MNGDEGDEDRQCTSAKLHFDCIQINGNGEMDTIARLTKIDAEISGVSFKSHTGRWEPPPEEGECDEMINMLVEGSRPNLDPANY